MAQEKYEYPASGPVTASWIPSVNHEESGALYVQDDGILGDQSAGKQIYLYEEGIKTRIHRLPWTLMTPTEETDYETFRSTVAGDTFKYTDFNAVAHTVTFVPGEREKTVHGNSTYSWLDLLREEL